MNELFHTTCKSIGRMIARNRAAIPIIGLGFLIRIPLILFSSELWRPVDTACIAHFFLVNGHRILYPQIFWGGYGPGYVEAEFRLHTFIVSPLNLVFGENMWLGLTNL